VLKGIEMSNDTQKPVLGLTDGDLEEIARRVLAQGYKHRDFERRFADQVAAIAYKRGYDFAIEEMDARVRNEREACARVCDELARKNHTEHHLYQNQIDKGVRLSKAVGLGEGAAAIRARDNE
jgi:hypothetical protein